MPRFRFLLIALLLVGAFACAAHGETRGGFDDQGRLLMHGSPRFVLGVYDSGGAYAPAPAHWEQQIFAPTGPRGLAGIPLNLYLNYWMGAMPIDSTNALLDVLHTHGMMYLQTGNCSGDGSWTRYGPGSFSIMSRDYVEQFARHPSALGYYTMDECDDALIAETALHDQQLHAWDPAGITLAATVAAGYRDPARWIGTADVLATDPYPLYGPEPAAGYTHFIVADFVSKLRAAAKPTRPVWAVLQFFKFTTDSRMPTSDELRAHAVMAIVEGAEGLLWWDVGVNGLRQLDAATVSAYMGHLGTLVTELAGLEPALVAEDAQTALVGNSTRFADPIAGRIEQLQHNVSVEWLYSREEASRKLWYQEELTALLAGDTSKSGGMLDGAANVRTLTKIVDGVGYVFAYNYTNVARPVTFTWHQAPTSVKESRTGQSFTVTGASWSDTFGPYQARVYVIRGAGTTPPSAPASLAQFAADGVTAIPVGGTVSTRSVVLAATIADPHGDAVKLQVEVGPPGVAFTGIATHESSLLAGGGQARVVVTGLANAVDYRWRARAVNGQGAGSAWIEFAAGRAVTERDFAVAVVSFGDVRSDESFWPWIEALVQAGITKGCATDPPLYCPDQVVTRGQIAVFLLRAVHGSGYAPPPASGVFADVPSTHPFAPWIERLFAEGIAGGCGTSPLRYCPDQSLTRAQMAALLLRGEHGASYDPPAATGTFADVARGHPFAGFIEQLASEGITAGCASSPARYCPDQFVTRGQMAVFLVRTFGLPM